MNRQEHISERLSTFFRETLHIYSSIIPRSDWLSLPLASQYRFGWIPPIDLDAVEVEDNMIAIISPEMIAAITADASDEDLEIYLTFIEATVAAYVQHRGEPAEKVERDLEDLLWREAPGTVELRNDLEMQALDAGIIPVLGN